VVTVQSVYGSQEIATEKINMNINHNNGKGDYQIFSLMAKNKKSEGDKNSSQDEVIKNLVINGKIQPSIETVKVDTRLQEIIDILSTFFKGSVLEEYEEFEQLLCYKNMEKTPTNTTKCLSQLFKAEYEGYVQQTSQHSHVWQLRTN
jgi:hypothetical protein